MKFRSVRSRLNLWFLIVALVPLTVVIAVIYQQRVHSIKEEAFSKLTAIREFKVLELEHWLNIKVGDLKILAGESELEKVGEIFPKENLNDSDRYLIQMIRETIESRVSNYQDYVEIFIISPSTGKILISTDINSEGEDKSKGDYFFEPLQSGTVFIKDIYYSKALHSTAMTLSAPIFSHSKTGYIVGILVARIDLSQSLFELLLDRTGMGRTGETLIVSQDVVALNELRWHENAPLKLKIDAKPAVLAAQGKTGIVEALDYRGTNVLAAYAFIPRTKWGFIAKQDQAEIYRPIRDLLRNCLIIFVISSIAVYLISFFVTSNLAAPLRVLAAVAGKLQTGDLSVRSGLRRPDEIGSLAESFDKMADSLTARMDIQSSMAEIMDSLVAADLMADFGKSVLQKLLNITSSEFGAFHLFAPNENKFEAISSIGVSGELLESIDAGNPVGELGKAIESGRINHIRDIPDDTVFQFKTFTGAALPKEIITIPLLSKGRVEAVLSLASLRSYGSTQLDIIYESWQGLNTGFANVRANDRTRNLAASLEEINQELERQKTELQRQSEELQEQNAALEMQRLEVVEANRLKSEFLSNMSHELRTPLNSIMALSRVLAMQATDKLTEEEQDYLNVIGRNGKKLLDLINDILDLSKIEAGRMDVSISCFSIRNLIDSILESTEVIAREKGIDICNNIPDDLPEIESDEGRLYQIFQNLLSNAVKFTKEGGVTVSAEYDEQSIFVNVKDTGIGIADQNIAHIFDEFRQVDGSSARNFGGTGLGLAIASRAASLLGGEITVTSKLDKGAIFTVQLPIYWSSGKQAIVDRPLDYIYDDQSKKRTILVVDGEPDAAEMFAGQGAIPRATSGNNILIVEDNAEAIIQVSNALERAGYNVAVERGGAAAIEYVKSTIPDGIILDLMMPEVDGFAVLEKIRGSEETARVPVLILTAKDLSKEDLRRLSYNNIQQLVQKGNIDLEGLLFKVEMMLGNHPKVNDQAPIPPLKTVEKSKDATEVSKTTSMEGKPVVLVVEDNPDNLLTVRAILKGRYGLVEATDGVTGLEKITAHLPNLVLLDIALPKMDGYAVVKAIKGKTKNIPVIALTAHAMKGDREKILAAGCDDCIAKPIDPEELIIRIDKWLNTSNA